jgi:hypothetical protein
LAFKQIPKDRVREYTRTLDVKALGDLSEYDDPPDVFTVKPLRVDHEAFVDVQVDDNGNMSWGETNYWAIFRAHVSDMSGVDLKLKDGFVDNSIRQLLPPDVIRDIAQKIVNLANKGDEVFHSPPVGFMEFYQTLLLQPVTNVPTAAATNKS